MQAFNHLDVDTLGNMFLGVVTRHIFPSLRAVLSQMLNSRRTNCKWFVPKTGLLAFC